MSFVGLVTLSIFAHYSRCGWFANRCGFDSAVPRSPFPFPLLMRQIVHTIVTEYEIQFPSLVQQVSNGSSVANLSFFTIFEIGCKARDLDHFDELMVVTFVPFCIVVAFALVWVFIRSCCRCVSKERREKYQLYPFVAILVTCFLCYSVASSTIVQSFRCISFDDGQSLLLVDFKMNCNTSRYALVTGRWGGDGQQSWLNVSGSTCGASSAVCAGGRGVGSQWCLVEPPMTPVHR